VLSVGRLVDQLSEQITSLGLSSYNGVEIEHEIALEVDGKYLATNIALQQKLFSELDAACRAVPEPDVDENADDVVDFILIELRQGDRLRMEQRFERIFGGNVR
jgi:hypothetical protein